MDNVLIPNAWDHTVFARLFAQSPKKAFEYRLNSTGTPIPEEYLDESVSIDAEAVSKNDELSVEQLKELLTEKGIKFSHLAGEKKLKELAVENNLI